MVVLEDWRPPVLDRPSFDLANIDVIKATKLAGKLKTNKSSCIKHVRSNVVKDFLLAKPDLLVRLVNTSIEHCEFPDSLKTASVTPLPKTGDCKKVTNWRPVSQLSILSKIIEKAVHHQLMSYLIRFDIIDGHQFGFMPQRSTSDACFGLIQFVYESRNRGEVVSIVFLNLRKAFDTVNHSVLLNELIRMGCSIDTVKWFRSYLFDRSQCTVVNGHTSTKRNIDCGVPQGSVLGPLLFNIYINGIVSNLQNCVHYMYADDLALCVANKDPVIARMLLQDDLTRTADWCESFRLTVNCDKSHVLWCHPEGDGVNYNEHRLSLKGKLLTNVTVFNYLGVLIDESCNFSPLCDRVNNSVKNKLRHMRRTKKVMEEETSLTLYKQMVLPVLDYCDFVLEGAPEGLVDDLQTLQNHCLRTSLGIWDPRLISRTELHRRCKCDKLELRRNEHLLSLMYRYTRDPDNLVVDVRVLRSNSKRKIKLQRPKDNLYKKSPLYRGNLLWSKLTAEDQNIATHSLFMKKLQKV